MTTMMVYGEDSMNAKRAKPWLMILILLLFPGCARLSLVGNKGLGTQVQDPAELIGLAQGDIDVQSQHPGPDSRINIMLAKVQLARANENLPLATEILESILKNQPDHPETCRQYAIVKIQQGDFTTAEIYLQRALKTDPNNPKINNDYGYFCYLQNRWDEAERYLSLAATLDSHLADAKANLGILYARKGLKDQAREYFVAAGCNESEIINNLTFVQTLNHAEKPTEPLKHSEQVESESKISGTLQSSYSRRVSHAGGNVQVAGHRF